MSNANKVRIIGGKWRGRKIRFPSVSDLRPSGDRIRETVFNWLQPDIPCSTCLDLFAGTGALGFEALSRGAAKVVFVENQRELVVSLQETAAWLETDDAIILQSNALSEGTAARISEFEFDIVFLDPPFQQGLVIQSLEWMQQHVRLKSGAIIYLETEKKFDISTIEAFGEIKKSKTSGHVMYSLLLRQ